MNASNNNDSTTQQPFDEKSGILTIEKDLTNTTPAIDIYHIIFFPGRSPGFFVPS
jgi:hypothetical protein